ncbi:MAG: formylglycine-generating enzyme family protein, partial [Actinomycetota bacterium]|nr:formylglycine-generating enzyme family protein [Actinomycetota bacterium]
MPPNVRNSPSAARPKGMVWIPSGTFAMGSDHFYPEEQPAHRATVASFWMDEHPVTVAEFRRFVVATGYVTVAERPPDPALYPGAALE